MEDCLVIAVDVSQSDRPTILVTRNDDENDLGFKVVNQLWDKRAEKIYHELIGDDKSCGWCNKYDEVLCDDWGNCFKWCPICGRNLGNGY